MATYLLTCNPAKWNWRNLAVEARALRKGKKLRGNWSCGVSKLIRPGDRLFLLKQGTKPRGIVASGWAKSKPYDAPHWDLVKRRKGIPHDSSIFNTTRCSSPKASRAWTLQSCIEDP